MPSGREIHTIYPYQPPQLDGDRLAMMRMPVEPGTGYGDVNEDDSDDDDDGQAGKRYAQDTPGAFPNEHAAESSYY